MTKRQRLCLPPPPPSIRPSLRAIGVTFKGLSNFIQYYVARQQARRDADVQRFAEDVIAIVNDVCDRQERAESELNNKVDADHFWSDEYLRVFRLALEDHVRTPDDAKRKYLLSFVENYAMERRPDVTLVQLLWRFVAQSTGMHLVVLETLYFRQRDLNTTDLAVMRTSSERPELVSIKQLLAEVTSEESLLLCLLADLEGNGLIERVRGPVNHEDASDRFILQRTGQTLMQYLHGNWPG